MATVILGSQWGDEGKGKIVDILAPEASLCARAQGGHNAGHSIVANGVSYDFHLLPSGLMNPRCINLIGSGVVVHVPTFFSELETLEEKGLSNVHDRILISDRCSIDFDLHVAVDGLEEIELGANSIGTTKRGIGPSYASRASRNAITISEMFREELFENKLRRLAEGYKKRYGDLLKYDVEEEIVRFKDFRARLAPYVTDAVALMEDAQHKNTKILIEGGQACMLDITFGTYPYVTSSSTGIGGVLTGLAVNPRKLENVVGVVKAYTTRVGGGPFPTEDTGEIGTKLQDQGREWGVSTGRRRRCGWLDLVVVKYSHAINHYDSINLTKLDILDNFPTIKVAVGYKDPATGQPLASFPADLDLLGKVEVEYTELPGWNQPTTGARTFEDLPQAARDYIIFIEKFLAVNGKGPKVRWIGTGPGREAMIDRGA